MNTTLTLRLPADEKKRMDALAEATGRTKSFLALEAIRQYLRREAWQVEEIRNALREAEEGDFASDDEVRDAFAKIRASKAS